MPLFGLLDAAILKDYWGMFVHSMLFFLSFCLFFPRSLFSD